MSVVVNNLLNAEQWRAYALVYGFVGNELLTPMNRSGNLNGLDPEFWGHMPEPDTASGKSGLNRLFEYAKSSCEQDDGDTNPNVPGMLNASVEFARLFIGPPKPAAAPWETANDPYNDQKVGYGRATIAMQGLLADEGLELSGENRQFEDHMGIELLYLAALCEKAATAFDAGEGEDAVRSIAGRAAWFIKSHPKAWLEALRVNVDANVPDGYYSALLEYADGVLEDQIAALV